MVSKLNASIFPAFEISSKMILQNKRHTQILSDNFPHSLKLIQPGLRIYPIIAILSLQGRYYLPSLEILKEHQILFNIKFGIISVVLMPLCSQLRLLFKSMCPTQIKAYLTKSSPKDNPCLFHLLHWQVLSVLLAPPGKHPFIRIIKLNVTSDKSCNLGRLIY